MPNSNNHHRLLYNPSSHLKQTFQKLGAQYDLLFFFESTCPEAQVLAQNLYSFNIVHNWQTWAISLDAKGLTHFPSTLTAKDLWRKFDIAVHPALVAIHRKTKQHHVIAYGAASIESIEQNILTLLP